MKDSEIKDKAVFIIGFLAIFLALANFKDQLSLIIVPAGNRTYTLWNLVVFLACILMLSCYLYALNYIKYSFGKYQNNELVRLMFRAILFIANFLYAVALVLPLMVIIISLIRTSKITDVIESMIVFDKTIILIFYGIVFAIVIVVSAISAYFSGKKANISRDGG